MAGKWPGITAESGTDGGRPRDHPRLRQRFSEVFRDLLALALGTRQRQRYQREWATMALADEVHQCHNKYVHKPESSNPSKILSLSGSISPM